MRRCVTLFAVAVFVALTVLPGFAEGKKIYTNKDLEKYAGKKAQDTPMKYSGRKVTLDFDDANIIGVLTLLSDIARQDGYTLAADKRIQGKITLKMTDVSWDEVLDFLVENNNLTKTMKGKSIIISPPR